MRYGFASALDKYLTDPPEDNWSQYWEDLVGQTSDELFAKAEDWIDKDPRAGKWIAELFNKGIPPAIAAAILERAFNLYKIKP